MVQLLACCGSSAVSDTEHQTGEETLMTPQLCVTALRAVLHQDSLAYTLLQEQRHSPLSFRGCWAGLTEVTPYERAEPLQGRRVSLRPIRPECEFQCFLTSARDWLAVHEFQGFPYEGDGVFGRTTQITENLLEQRIASMWHGP